jgi:ABC-type phosphate transport system substrate-binding protein
MKLIKLQLLGSVAVGVLASATTPAAAAAPAGLYAGGATFPEKVYRDIFDCYGSTSGGQLTSFLSGPPAICNLTPPYRAGVEILYAGSGSGNALKAFRMEDGSLFVDGAKKLDRPPVVGSDDLGSFFGTGTGASWTPVAGSGPFYNHVSFVGSDDPLGSNLALYNCVNAGTWTGANNNPACTTAVMTTARGWGPALQFPMLIGAVAIGYQPAGAGVWNEQGTLTAGNPVSKLNLDTNTWCGIWTGAITDWNDPAITGSGTNGNHGISITGGVSAPIKATVRSDGSGTTFIFANALLHQCGTQSAPVAGITHPVPDSWATGGSGAGASRNATEANGTGISNNNWFLNLQASNGGPGLPAGWVLSSGNGGQHDTLTAVAGKGFVGYISTDFVRLSNATGPDSTGPRAANLQTWASFKAGALTSTYKAPTSANAAKIMTYTTAEPTTYLKPPSFNAHVAVGLKPSCDSLAEGCADNPAAWSKTNPTPNNTAAYPIGGFTFADMYSCYASATDVDSLVGTTAGSLGFFRWYFGSSTENTGTPKKSLAKNQFAAVPGAYVTAIKKLLTTNPSTKVGVPGVVGTACSAVGGPGA